MTDPQHFSEAEQQASEPTAREAKLLGQIGRLKQELGESQSESATYLSALEILANSKTTRAGDFVDIVFDGKSGPLGARFVECEDSNGKSIALGEWLERDDGYLVLRIKSNRAELERLRAFGDALYGAALAIPDEDDWLGEHLRNWVSARATKELKGN